VKENRPRRRATARTGEQNHVSSGSRRVSGRFVTTLAYDSIGFDYFSHSHEFGCLLQLTALHEISTLLNTGLDRNSLSILVQLCEMGVNPGALVHGE
jgi:hypothetical protein